MKNVLQYDIKTSSTQKGYMYGFQGFANVVKNINLKLSKNTSEREYNSWPIIEKDDSNSIVQGFNCENFSNSCQKT